MGRPFLLSGLLAWLAAGWAHAGGSGLNVAVVVNQASSNSVALGNYYCERRQVPPDNVLRISWNGGNTVWNSDQFQTNLVNPLLTLLATRGLTNQVDYVVLSMDVPFQVSYGTAYNSTTSALFYGLKSDQSTVVVNTNSYFGSERVFAQARPASAPGPAFLAMMLTGNSLAQAKRLVDQGVSGDGTFPSQPVLLAKSSDYTRNVRYPEFDNAVFNARVRGGYGMWRTDSDSPWGQTNLLGYETGLASFSLSPGSFIPGAMADSLSSYGGVIFGASGQTSLLAFLQAGAAGSYGTVTEPSPSPSKFPNPQAYFYQARGFSLAECYYQSLFIPCQGLLVGEPLSAPFAQPGRGAWSGAAANGVLSGTAQLSVAFTAASADRPLQQVDLFVDGRFYQTLTNLGPRAGNQLVVTLNGYAVTNTVSTNDGVAGVAAALAARLNSPAVANVTRVSALAMGDRIELHSLSTNLLGEPFFFADPQAGAGPRYYRARYLVQAPAPLLTGAEAEPDGTFRLQMATPPGMPAVVQASTDLQSWFPLWTNAEGGLAQMVDMEARRYPQRFYRLAEPAPDNHLSLMPRGLGPAGFEVQVQTTTPLAYALRSTTDFRTWTGLATNLAGGPMDFLDSQATALPGRFYQAVLLTQGIGSPALSVSNPALTGTPILRVDAAGRPYTIEMSTDLAHWTVLLTNFAVGQLPTTAASSIGSAERLTTFLGASRPGFLASQAYALRGFKVNGVMNIGTWLQLSIRQTNGVTLKLGVTNHVATASVSDLAQQLYALVNATPQLQGGEGVAAKDWNQSWFGEADFNLVARAPGLAAGLMQVQLSGSPSLWLSPTGMQALGANLSDLQPRNHLYVRAGAPQLKVTFPLDTTALPDGFHELTAVAYEGSSVRTQTRALLPVQIRNTGFSASLNLLDLSNNAPVQGTYHLQVTAGTDAVAVASLFSTGGLLGTVTNQVNPTFTLSGMALGAGLHPFYALVQNGLGAWCRTETHWVRLGPEP